MVEEHEVDDGNAEVLLEGGNDVGSGTCGGGGGEGSMKHGEGRAGTNGSKWQWAIEHTFEYIDGLGEASVRNDDLGSDDAFGRGLNGVAVVNAVNR